MRALFTQLSLLIGVLTTLNLNAEQMSFGEALLWGASAGIAIYMVLLLGDYVVHRLLEEQTMDLSSVVFTDTPPEMGDSNATTGSSVDDTGALAA